MIELRKAAKSIAGMGEGDHELFDTRQLQLRDERVFLPTVKRSDRSMWHNFYYPENSSPSDIRGHKSMKITDAITQPIPPNIIDLQPRRDITNAKSSKRSKQRDNKHNSALEFHSQRQHRNDVLDSLKRLSLIEPFLLDKAEKRAWLEMSNISESKLRSQKFSSSMKAKTISSMESAYQEIMNGNHLRSGDLLSKIISAKQDSLKRSRKENSSPSPDIAPSNEIVGRDSLSNEHNMNEGRESGRQRKKGMSSEQALPSTATVVDMSTGGVIESGEVENTEIMSGPRLQYQRANSQSRISVPPSFYYKRKTKRIKSDDTEGVISLSQPSHNTDVNELRGLLKTANSFNSSNRSSSHEEVRRPLTTSHDSTTGNDKVPPSSPNFLKEKPDQKIVIDLRPEIPVKQVCFPDDQDDYAINEFEHRPTPSVPLCTPCVDSQTFQIFPTNRVNMVHAYMGPNSQPSVIDLDEFLIKTRGKKSIDKIQSGYTNTRSSKKAKQTPALQRRNTALSMNALVSDIRKKQKPSVFGQGNDDCPIIQGSSALIYNHGKEDSKESCEIGEKADAEELGDNVVNEAKVKHTYDTSQLNLEHMTEDDRRLLHTKNVTFVPILPLLSLSIKPFLECDDNAIQTKQQKSPDDSIAISCLTGENKRQKFYPGNFSPLKGFSMRKRLNNSNNEVHLFSKKTIEEEEENFSDDEEYHNQEVNDAAEILGASFLPFEVNEFDKSVGRTMIPPRFKLASNLISKSQMKPSEILKLKQDLYARVQQTSVVKGSENTVVYEACNDKMENQEVQQSVTENNVNKHKDVERTSSGVHLKMSTGGGFKSNVTRYSLQNRKNQQVLRLQSRQQSERVSGGEISSHVKSMSAESKTIAERPDIVISEPLTPRTRYLSKFHPSNNE